MRVRIPFQEVNTQYNSQPQVKNLLFNNAQESLQVGQEVTQNNIRQSNLYNSSYFNVQEQTDILYTLESYCRVTKMNRDQLIENLSQFFVQKMQGKQVDEKENLKELEFFKNENMQLKEQIKQIKKDFENLKEKQQENLQELEQNLMEISNLYEQKIKELTEQKKQPKILKSKLLNSQSNLQQSKEKSINYDDQNFFELIKTVKQLNDTLIKENKFLKNQLKKFQELKDPEKLISEKKLDSLITNYQRRMKNYKQELNEYESLIKKLSQDIQKLSSFYQEDISYNKNISQSISFKNSNIVDQKFSYSEQVVESEFEVTEEIDSIEGEIKKKISNGKICDLFKNMNWNNQMQFQQYMADKIQISRNQNHKKSLNKQRGKSINKQEFNFDFDEQDKEQYIRYQALDKVMSTQQKNNILMEDSVNIFKNILQQKQQKLENITLKQNSQMESYQDLISILIKEYIETEEQIQELSQQDQKQSIFHSTNILNKIFQFRELLDEDESLQNFQENLKQFQNVYKDCINQQKIKINQTEQKIEQKLRKTETEMRNLDYKVEEEIEKRKVSKSEYKNQQNQLDIKMEKILKDYDEQTLNIVKDLEDKLNKKINALDQIQSFINLFFEFLEFIIKINQQSFQYRNECKFKEGLFFSLKFKKKIEYFFIKNWLTFKWGKEIQRINQPQKNRTWQQFYEWKFNITSQRIFQYINASQNQKRLQKQIKRSQESKKKQDYLKQKLKVIVQCKDRSNTQNSKRFILSPEDEWFKFSQYLQIAFYGFSST